MGRIRSIKPEFFLHEDLAELSPLHRLAFIGLWTQADREGRLEDRPKRLAAALFPYEQCDMEAILGDLHNRGFIFRYKVGPRSVLAIPSFGQHQRPHSKEAESLIPPPDSVLAPERSVPAGERSVLARREWRMENGEGNGEPEAIAPDQKDRQLRNGIFPRPSPFPWPPDWKLTPEQALLLKAHGCTNPSLGFHAFRLYYEAIREEPEKGWHRRWDTMLERWALNHARFGCPCQRQPTPADKAAAKAETERHKAAAARPPAKPADPEVLEEQRRASIRAQAVKLASGIG